VLLLVLAVLVLMVAALSQLSTISLRRALAAADEQVRLQQRVGAESIERALLPRAAALFDARQKAAEQQLSLDATNPPPGSSPYRIRAAVSFGGVTFDVVLADEDAKLNLNRVYHAAGKQRVDRAVAELSGPVAARALRTLPAVRPLPQSGIGQREDFDDADDEDDGDEGDEKIPRAFRSWGEVFDLPRLAAVAGTDAALPNVTQSITCWGGGALNLRRASDEAIRAAAACILSEGAARRLVSRYRDNPAVPLEVLLVGEATSESERIRLRRMLGESSSHFSLWLDASTTSRRSLRRFSVMQLTEDGVTINERFSF
jgi:hypothetical protein